MANLEYRKLILFFKFSFNNYQFSLDFDPKLSMKVQPMSHGVRFRYITEKTVGTLRGKGSTKDNPSFPIVLVEGLRDSEVALIVGYTVTTTKPHLVHGHDLSGDDCHNGVFKKTVNRNGEVEIQVGITCSKRKDLKRRSYEKMQVIGCDNRNFLDQDYQMDDKSLKICFELHLFLGLNCYKKVSQIYTSSITSVPPVKIKALSHHCGPIEGKTRMIFVTENLKSKNVTVIFQDELGWIAKGKVIEINKESVEVLSPPYTGEVRCANNILVEVFLEVSRKNGMEKSKPVRFHYDRRMHDNWLGPNIMQSTVSQPLIEQFSQNEYEKREVPEVCSRGGKCAVSVSENQKYMIPTVPSCSPEGCRNLENINSCDLRDWICEALYGTADDKNSYKNQSISYQENTNVPALDCGEINIFANLPKTSSIALENNPVPGRINNDRVLIPEANTYPTEGYSPNTIHNNSYVVPPYEDTENEIMNYQFLL